MRKDYGFKPIPVNEAKDIREYTREEAKLMFAWYMDDLPKRTAYLFDYINRFTPIELDYTFDTFKKVIDWLPEVIRINMKTKKELKIEKKNTPKQFRKYIKIWEFNEDTQLLISAIGGYLGMVMDAEIEDTHWELEVNPQSSDYNLSIINKRNEAHINPIKVVDEIATGIVEKRNIDMDATIENLRK